MILKLPIRYEGGNGEKILYTLFDSGSSFSCIHSDFVKYITEPVRMGRPMEVETAGAGNHLTISEKIVTEFYIEDFRLSDEFLVVPGLTEEAIIGATTLQKWRIKLDFEHDIVVIDPRVARHILYDLKFYQRRAG